MVYYGESGKINIYSRPDDGCQEFLTKGPISKIEISYWSFGCKNFICGLIIICDWQHLEMLEISWFHFSEQSFGMPPIVPNFTRS